MSVKLRDLLVGKDYFVEDHDNDVDDEDELRNCEERWMTMTIISTGGHG